MDEWWWVCASASLRTTVCDASTPIKSLIRIRPTLILPGNVFDNRIFILVLTLIWSRHFQDYVQNHTDWKICEHFNRGGHWRLLTIRSNHKNELMIIVTVHPQNLSAEEIHSEMERMKDYLLSCPINQLTSLYYQTWYLCCQFLLTTFNAT